MKRRDFVTLVGSAAAAWPLAARAQRDQRTRGVAVLMGLGESDPAGPPRIVAFKQALADLGWTEGKNIRIDAFWSAGDTGRIKALAKQIVGQQPEVIVAHTAAPALALQKETNSIPIVFNTISDPYGAGLIDSLTRPGSNITGFTNMESTMGAKWLQTLKEIDPLLKRLTVPYNPSTSPISIPFFKSAEAAAAGFSIQTVAAPINDSEELEPIMSALGSEQGNGMMFTPDIFTATHRNQIIALAARYQLPAIYPYRFFVTDGGLISYGTNPIEQFAQSAGYVDRILRGAKPGELPIQAPVKFELIINLKTAKALGLTIPSGVLSIADEVIE
jgi:putative tryptophan/tyrosine transport system substrate-binding protein